MRAWVNCRRKKARRLLRASFQAGSLLRRLVALRLALALVLRGFPFGPGLLLVGLCLLLRFGAGLRLGRGVGLRRLGERAERERRGHQHRYELLKHDGVFSCLEKVRSMLDPWRT